MSKEYVTRADKPTADVDVDVDAEDRYEPVTMVIGGKVYGVGCGNDWEDIFLISACYGSLWSFLIAFFALLLKGAVDSDEKNTLLYMYLTFGVIYVILVGLGVYTGQMQKDELARKKAKMGLDADAVLPVDDDE